MISEDQDFESSLTGFKVKFAVGSNVYHGNLQKLSEYGMFVQVDEMLPVDNLNKSCMVIVRGMLEREKIEMDIKSSIVKIKESGVGLLAKQLDDADRTVLLQLINCGGSLS